MPRTCKDWNEAGCEKPGKDRNHCGYGGSALRHGCSRVEGSGRLCWSREHKEREHK